MSDTAQGPGWWLASDGKWYPPQAASRPGPPPPAPSPPGMSSPGPPPPVQGGYPTAPPPWAYAQAPPKKGHGCAWAALAAIGLVVLFAVIALVAVGSALHNTNGFGKGSPTHPSAADVSISTCMVDQTLHVAEAEVTITNHSSGRSNYLIDISFVDPSGTVIAQGVGAEDAIEAGQTADDQVVGRNVLPAGAQVTCRVASVTRYAST